MTHWFHRSNLKATTIINYNGVLSGGINLSKLASDMKKSRDHLLELIPDPAHTMDTINTAYMLYLSLMVGFLSDSGMSKQTNLRRAIEYRWTHSLLGQGAQVQKDAAFDVANMSVNVALWHMKHASTVSSKPSIDMDDAKEVHTSLRKAAGLFKFVKNDLIPLIDGNIRPGSDLDPRVLSGYMSQCMGEAQEVTVARAIELKHNKSLISALAADTSKMFNQAVSEIREVDKAVTDQWRHYLNIKFQIYQAYAFSYLGHNLLDENQCGVAIRALQESVKCYNDALALCKPYSKLKGPARRVKPDGHKFFTNIYSTVTITLEKCERENGFIYHQKVPHDPPELPSKATYGLASPEEYSLPQAAPLWHVAAEDAKAFQAIAPQDAAKPSGKESAGKEDEKLPEVKEKSESSAQKPGNDHGCVLQ